MFFTKKHLDEVFLTAKNPYSQKRRLNIKNISIAFITVLFSFSNSRWTF